MDLRIRVDLDNDAFYHGYDGNGDPVRSPGPELGRILRTLAEQAEGDMLMNGDRVYDVNGNSVGDVVISMLPEQTPDPIPAPTRAQIADGMRQHAAGLDRMAREIEAGA
jgi:hypothetical protein